MANYLSAVARRFLRAPARVTLRLIEIVTALLLLSRPTQLLQAWLLPTARLADVEGGRIALVAHVFYPDIWLEIVEAWSALPAGSRLVVTTTDEKAAEIRRLTQGQPLMEVHQFENRGRDLGPFIALLNSGAFDRFDAILKLHTKKSPHLAYGDLRRKLLFTSLAGTKSNVLRILSHFSDQRVGLVGFAPLFRTARWAWMGNRETIERLCRRMHPNGEPSMGFFEGSMFWVRPAALAPLRSASLKPEEFESEAGQLDGTLHHGIERTIAISAQAAGLDTLSIRGRVLMRGRPTSTKIASNASPPAT